MLQFLSMLCINQIEHTALEFTLRLVNTTITTTRMVKKSKLKEW